MTLAFAEAYAFGGARVLFLVHSKNKTQAKGLSIMSTSKSFSRVCASACTGGALVFPVVRFVSLSLTSCLLQFALLFSEREPSANRLLR